MEASFEHWINGERRGAGRAGSTEHTTSWNTRSETLYIPCASLADWSVALDSAERSSRALAFAPPSIQAAPHHRLLQALADRAPAFVDSIELDLAWCFAQAQQEVERSLQHFEALLHGGDPRLQSAQPLEGKRGGVLVLRPPHDAPLLGIFRAMGAGLRAGNAIVIAAATTAPRVLLPLIDALESSDLHAGTVQVVFGRHTTFEEAIATRREKLVLETWTRWTPTAPEHSAEESNALAGSAERRLGEDRPATAAAIGPDADLSIVAPRIADQLCHRSGGGYELPRTLLVHEDVAAELCDALVETLRSRAAEADDRAPLIEEGAVRRAEAFVRRALEEGVSIPQGGQADARGKRKGGVWYEPTVLVNVPPESMTACGRVRAPIGVICRYDSFSELISRLDRSAFERVWTSADLAATWRDRGLWQEHEFAPGSLAPPEVRDSEGLFSAPGRDRINA